MRRKRFTEEQIIGILKDHEAGQTAAELAREHNQAMAGGVTGSVNRHWIEPAPWSFWSDR
jgi:hypothetical protein